MIEILDQTMVKVTDIGKDDNILDLMDDNNAHIFDIVESLRKWYKEHELKVKTLSRVNHKKNYDWLKPSFELHVLYYALDDDENPIPCIWEPDMTIFQMNFLPEHIQEISNWLMILFNYCDCTDCCDAIESINITQGFTYSKTSSESVIIDDVFQIMVTINSGQTFHS